MTCSMCGGYHPERTACPFQSRTFVPSVQISGPKPYLDDRASIVAWLRAQGMMDPPAVLAARDRWADAIEAGVDRV